MSPALLGFLLVRRARAARRRQIDAVDSPAPRPRASPKRPARGGAGARARARRSADEQRTRPKPEREPEPAATPAARRPRPGVAARAGPAAGRAPGVAPAARPAEPETVPAAPAQVIPFPVPPRRPRRPSAKTALLPGLARTRAGWVARLRDVFSGRKELDPAVVGEIEKVLLTADIGVRTSQQLLEEIRSSLSKKELADPDAVWAFLRRRSTEMLTLPAPPVDFSAAHPFVLLIIGVNGSGKTTTIGKLAAKLAADGKKVLLAAGDTFRAAAVEQLDVWAQRDEQHAGARQGGRRPVVGDLRRASNAPRRKDSTWRSPTPPDACTRRPT